GAGNGLSACSAELHRHEDTQQYYVYHRRAVASDRRQRHDNPHLVRNAGPTGQQQHGQPKRVLQRHGDAAESQHGKNEAAHFDCRTDPRSVCLHGR
ncbi:unnamed protein product, partial [Ectocarpus fasciculatus]